MVEHRVEHRHSFAVLQAQKRITPANLMVSLEEYATSGAAISSEVVIGIINRTRLTKRHKASLRESARKGMLVHRRMSERKSAEAREAAQYARVADHLKA